MSHDIYNYTCIVIKLGYGKGDLSLVFTYSRHRSGERLKHKCPLNTVSNLFLRPCQAGTAVGHIRAKQIII